VSEQPIYFSVRIRVKFYDQLSVGPSFVYTPRKYLVIRVN
jgi:hypothetical protein